MKDIFAKIWFSIAQLLTIPANFVLTRILKLKVSRPTGFKISRGTLIIANHQSKIDPFLISYHIGIKNWSTMIPIRYPVTHEYMELPILSFFIKLLGGYNIGKTAMERLKKLAFTRDLLKKGYSVVLFPEGKISREVEKINEFQRGAEMLFTYNYPVIFVKLTGLNDKHKYHFWKNKSTKFEYSEFLGVDVPAAKKVEAMMEFYQQEYVPNLSLTDKELL